MVLVPKVLVQGGAPKRESEREFPFHRRGRFWQRRPRRSEPPPSVICLPSEDFRPGLGFLDGPIANSAPTVDRDDRSLRLAAGTARILPPGAHRRLYVL